MGLGPVGSGLGNLTSQPMPGKKLGRQARLSQPGTCRAAGGRAPPHCGLQGELVAMTWVSQWITWPSAVSTRLPSAGRAGAGRGRQGRGRQGRGRQGRGRRTCGQMNSVQSNANTNAGANHQARPPTHVMPNHSCRRRYAAALACLPSSPISSQPPHHPTSAAAQQQQHLPVFQALVPS